MGSALLPLHCGVLSTMIPSIEDIFPGFEFPSFFSHVTTLYSVCHDCLPYLEALFKSFKDFWRLGWHKMSSINGAGPFSACMKSCLRVRYG